ncbi:hypothetical protein ASFV_Kyiv_2016_131_00236 [African swine fever virus]|uniref:Uncharacterized protein n=1 Tax=African swine fever virus TaxID=10497 RepID=A0A5B8XB11_ASF|nr:hypothetical protein ASFV_Kyiv_2016_131_00236 [African swine fever virus]
MIDSIHLLLTKSSKSYQDLYVFFQMEIEDQQ